MGGGSKKKAPPAPDYTALMKQQQAADLANYQKQIQDQRTSTVTPYGTSSWSQDASGKWVNTQSLSPELQQAYNQYLSNQGQSLGVQKTALDQLAQLQAAGGFKGPDITASYDPNYANQYATDYTKQLLARITPQQQVDQTQMDTKLRQQGLVPGTEAYDRAYKNLITAQGDVNTQANLQGMIAGQNAGQQAFQTSLQEQQAKYNNALQNYLLPWQTASQAAGLAGNMQMPNFGSTTTSTPGLATPDLVGAAQQSYAQQMQNYNQQQASKSNKGSSLGTVVGGVAGGFFGGPVGAAAGASIGGAAGGALFSDPALKDRMEQLDDEAAFDSLLELAPFTWNWKGLKTAGAGVAADQIAERFPELVSIRGGSRAVDYPALTALLLGALRYLAKQVRERDNG